MCIVNLSCKSTLSAHVYHSRLSALAKDYVSCGWVIRLYSRSNRIEPDDGSKSKLKINKMILSTFMEDFWQVGIQYFYVDKFAAQTDSFGRSLIVFNAVFMLLRIVLYIKCLIPLAERKWKTIILIFHGFLPLLMQLSRAYGSMKHVYITAPNVRGACLRYDYQTATVVAQPFSTDCLEVEDWILIVSAILTCTIFLLEALVMKFNITSKDILLQEKKLQISDQTKTIEFHRQKCRNCKDRFDNIQILRKQMRHLTDHLFSNLENADSEMCLDCQLTN